MERICDVSEEEIRAHPLLADLDEAATEDMRAAARRLRVKAGETLFRQGEDAGQFFMLLKGQVKLFRISPAGQEKIIDLVGPGQTFAEAVPFMERRTFPVHAEALRDSELVALPSNTLRELLLASPKLCFRVMGSLSMRLRARLSEIEALSLQNSSLRLINFLLQRLGADACDGTVIKLDVARRTLAARLSVQPETLSRILHGLEHSGVVSIRGRYITVNDLEQLRHLATGDSQ
ncbi:MAG: Crp/Fnr family transcriptional regulator [Gammaproteobacteria bacterium]